MARVLITGGSSGIGLASAVRFAGRGDQVAVIARDPDGLEAVRARTRQAGTACLCFTADVSDRPALGRQVAAVAAALGGIDIAVVAAAASTYGRFRDTPADDFDRVLEVTLRGTVDTVRELLPHLERSGGCLIVVGSVAGTMPLPRMSAYTASKHAIRGFVETLRVELAAERSPIALSLVEPGPVDTPFWDNVTSEDGLLPPSIPFAYVPEEVAIAIEQIAETRGGRATVGGAWALIRVVHTCARPLTEWVLARAMLLAERRGKRGAGARALWVPSGGGELRSGLLARPSLLVRGKVRLRHIWVSRGRIRRERKEER
jgi:NAD(P)-dependent dehydrogenase (short-subunit alcohol dehydrogenase family)